MPFDYDSQKNLSNKERHGISLGEACALWENSYVIIPAKNVLGEQGKIYVAIFTQRGEAIRLISCHRADKRWERIYYEYTKKKKTRQIKDNEFDRKFEKGENITPYLDFGRAVVVKRVNVDFPTWMIDLLDKEALRLNVSRQAIIKLWIGDRLGKTTQIAG